MSTELLPTVWTMHVANGDWYPIQPSTKCTPERHGELNPHVCEIRDASGQTLWRREAKAEGQS